MAVPLLRNDVAVGVIRISRTQIEPFTDAQITLLEIFADQAVIAIENVRLFEELQARNRDLSEALDSRRRRATSCGSSAGRRPTFSPSSQPSWKAQFAFATADLGGICRVEDGRLALIAFNPSTP